MGRFLKLLSLHLLVFAFVVLLLELVLPYNVNGYMREQDVKMSMLSDVGRKPSVVLLGGSNVAFGYDSKLIAESVRMPVINAGLHASVGLKYIIDDCFPRLKRGDILVLSPEYGHFFDKMAYGEAPMADLVYLSHFRLAGKLNRQQWYSLANNTPKYLRTKLEYTLLNSLPMAKDSVYSLSAFNEYGDAVAHWRHDENRYSERVTTPVRGKWNDAFFSYFVEKVKSLRSDGVRVIMYPPVIASTAYKNNRLNIEHVDSMLRMAGLRFAKSPAECVYNDTLFYDTKYHLRKHGAERHSRELADLINAMSRL